MPSFSIVTSGLPQFLRAGGDFLLALNTEVNRNAIIAWHCGFISSIEGKLIFRSPTGADAQYWSAWSLGQERGLFLQAFNPQVEHGIGRRRGN